jgi:tetratricopeptide (TPR) repeat protein
LRIDPNSSAAHASLGLALGHKGDLDGEIAEYREALRLDPQAADVHYNLGRALEREGDRQGALEEYRSAYKLNSQFPLFRQAYERLLQQVNQ